MTSEEAREYYEKAEYVKDAESFARSHRSERLARISKYIDLRVPACCLEVGCGAGIHSDDFPGWVGMDLSAVALRMADRAIPRVLALAELLPIRDSSVDIILAFNVIEHLYHPEDYLNEALRVVRDEGYIIIDSPNIVKKNDMVWFLTETIWVLLSELGLKRRLRAKFKQADYSKIGGDADAVYLVNMIDVMQFLTARQCKILSSRPWKIVWWMRGLKDPLIVAKVMKTTFSGPETTTTPTDTD